MGLGILIITLIAFLIAGMLFLKTEHNFRKVKIAIVILLCFFLYFSIVSVFSSEKVDLTSPRGITNAVYLYFGWVGNVLSNLWDVGVETTGAVVDAVKINRSG